MSQAADTPPPRSRGGGWKHGITVGLAVCGLVVVVAYLCFRNDLSPEECERLESKKNLAVGYLENGELKKREHRLPEADLLFQEIARAKPGDPLGPRNLAITRLLYLNGQSDAKPKAVAAANARQAAQALVAADEGSAIAHLLAGKIAAASGDEPGAAAELNRAAELAPDDPALWYELFELLKESKQSDSQRKALEALGHAYLAAPDNLALEVNWLEAQASAKDATIQQTAATLRSSLKNMPGLVANIKQNSKDFISNPLKWVDQVAVAAGKGDWPAVQRLVRPLINLMKPESWVQTDLRRVQRHPLDYVIYDFAEPCAKPAGKASGVPRNEVKLVELSAAAQLPALVGIADIALADFDLDGTLDVVVLRESSVEVYGRRQGVVGWHRLAEAPLGAGFQHLLIADFDRDDPQQPGTEAYRKARQQTHGAAGEASGNPPAADAKPPMGEKGKSYHRADLDVLVYGQAGLKLFRNDLNGDNQTRSLVEATLAPELGKVEKVEVLVAADFYHDGDLDLAFSTADGWRLWSNRGDMSFTDVTGSSELPPASMKPTALVAVDWDRDVDLDILASSSSGQPAGYLENLRHGQFRWRSFAAGFEALQTAESLALFDGESGGAWDLAVAGPGGATVVRTRSDRSGVASAQSAQQASRNPGRGLLTWDFDNDGYLDLLTWADKTMDFCRGLPGGEVVTIPPLLAIAPQNIRACRTGDLDGDGDEDLAIGEHGRVILYTNEGGNANRWLDVELRADITDQGDGQTFSSRANHFGLGSTIEVRCGSMWQRKLVANAKTHFGLDGQTDPDLVRVVWTTGVPQNVTQPGSDLVLFDEQVLGGSCPYLYTWNGVGFEFCTDCLWSAPLGLLVAEGQLAPSREWEYLRIDGDKLKQRDGCYPLQITEELWEAAYFDQVRLIAIDHPADVDVYSNEKVGPAELAKHKVHTARQPLRPVAARDQQGRDILDRIRRRDGVYVKAFDRRLAFGYTEDHFIELDFGPLDRPRQITLFLTGWIFPSGTSMSVGISQSPGLKAPAPPSLWVPDADGQWREVRSYMGFPGGKTKTIAVDLSDAFLTDDYRLRVATNMEFYWDEAFITVDEAPAEVRQTPLDLVDADLHFRGFSLRTRGENFGPEQYNYDHVITDPKWPAMRGRFTRYGDVRELLTENDDLLVVLGAGDELTLRFAAPDSPPPAGWKRDFLLYNVGWDKDCDLNTVYGETVEPLPYAGLSGYPYAAEDKIRDAARYREYLRTYQTRTQDPGLFWQPSAQKSQPSNHP